MPYANSWTGSCSSGLTRDSAEGKRYRTDMGSKSKNRKEHEAAPTQEPQEASQAEKAAEGDQGKPLEAEDLRASLEREVRSVL